MKPIFSSFLYLSLLLVVPSNLPHKSKNLWPLFRKLQLCSTTQPSMLLFSLSPQFWSSLWIFEDSLSSSCKVPNSISSYPMHPGIPGFTDEPGSHLVQHPVEYRPYLLTQPHFLSHPLTEAFGEILHCPFLEVTSTCIINEKYAYLLRIALACFSHNPQIRTNWFATIPNQLVQVSWIEVHYTTSASQSFLIQGTPH